MSCDAIIASGKRHFQVASPLPCSGTRSPRVCHYFNAIAVDLTLPIASIWGFVTSSSHDCGSMITFPAIITSKHKTSDFLARQSLASLQSCPRPIEPPTPFDVELEGSANLKTQNIFGETVFKPGSGLLFVRQVVDRPKSDLN